MKSLRDITHTRSIHKVRSHSSLQIVITYYPPYIQRMFLTLNYDYIYA